MVKIYTHGGCKRKSMVSGVFCNYKDININYSERVGQGSKKISQEIGICNCIEVIKSLGINEEITICTSNKELVSILKKEVITDKDIKKYPMVNEIKRFIISNNINIDFIKIRKNEAKTLVKEAYKGILKREACIVDFRSFETKKGMLMKVIFNGPKKGIIKYEEVIA